MQQQKTKFGIKQTDNKPTNLASVYQGWSKRK